MDSGRLGSGAVSVRVCFSGRCGSRRVKSGGGNLLGMVGLALTLRMVAWMSWSFLANARSEFSKVPAGLMRSAAQLSVLKMKNMRSGTTWKFRVRAGEQ